MSYKCCSILELRGLGKEIWKGIDAQEYVNQERDSFLESETTQKQKQMMQFGMFSGNQKSTEADFQIAEFHGDKDNCKVSD